MKNIAVVIVSWNVRELLADCLRSVQADAATSGLSAQIWVVDNASADDSAAMVQGDFPTVRLIASPTNLGFAGGNNAALRAIGFGEKSIAEALLPEMVLLLNPDTVVQPGALAALTDFLAQTPAAGIVGAQLAFGDGSFQHGAFGFPGLWQLVIELLPVPGRLIESRLNGRYPRQWYAQRQPFEIGHPLGAAMGVRREAIAQVGLLDEQYHMYVEEVDWSKRIVAAGWRAYCVPSARITHWGGQSTGQVRISSLLSLWASRYRFYRKHYGPLKVWLAGKIVQWGMVRKIGQAVENPALTEAERAELTAAYRQVINLWQGKSA
jgi:GT2 family glycosyltransferase